MSMTKTSINTFNQLRHIKPGNKVNVRHQRFSFNPLLSHHHDQLRISKRSVCSSFLDSSRSLRYLSNGKRGKSNNKSKMDFAICSSHQQGDLASFGSFMESWKGWILGGLVTVILPFLTHKWGPLLKWTKELEAAEERVEEMAEAIEKVAVEVEKVAEDVAENLPEGGRFKVAVTFVENAAKEVIKDADLVEEFIHKVEEVEKEVESIIIEEDVDAKSEEDAKEDNDEPN
ncbi:hypothetical protein LguiB_019771 [Lonicera macranthoides]